MITRSLALFALLAGTTIAAAEPKPAQPPAKPEDALKGPSVPDRQVPGVDNGLSEKTGGGKKDGTAKELPIPQQAFQRMVEGTLGPSASENIRLTEAQREQIKKINDDFASKQRAFMQDHREDIDRLIKEHPQMIRILRENGFPVPPGADGRRPGQDGKRQDRRPGPDGGKPPQGDRPAPPGDDMQGGKPPEMTPEDRSKLQEKVAELKALAPRQEDNRAAVWAVLNKEQQAAVQVKVDEFKAQRAKEMDERYKEREKQKLQERGKKDTKDGQPGGDAFKPLDAAQREEVLKSLPEDARQKIEGMPKEMQDRVLARLNNMPAEKRAQALEEMKKRQGEGRRPGKGPGKGEPPSEPKKD